MHKAQRDRLTTRGLLALAAMILAACQSHPATRGSGDAETLSAIAEEAYIYAYPMLQNYRTLDRMVLSGGRQFNRFYSRRQLLDARFKTIVAPNNDTLYLSAWLDLSKGPLLIDVPAIEASRYWSLQFIDLNVYNFAYLGQRASGSGGGRYAIIGPDFDGQTVAGARGMIRAESQLVFVIGRILVRDAADVEAVNAIQDRFKIRPGGRSETSRANEPLPRYPVEPLSPDAFVEATNALLSRTRLHEQDRAKLSRFAAIGLGRRSPLLNDRQREAIAEGVRRAEERITARTQAIGWSCNGWSSVMDGFGSREQLQDRVLAKAAAAKIGLYGHSPEENISYTTHMDSEGRPLDGSDFSYRLQFPAGQLPPVDAFWSLTLYRAPEMLFYDNPGNTYAIGDRSAGLAVNADGSLDILIQHERPSADEVVNWLPAPAGPFVLALRMYLPGPAIQRQDWCAPELIGKRRE